MNMVRFLIYTTLGTTLWNLILTWIGRVLGENWADVSELMAPYEYGVLILIGLAVVVFVGWRAVRWRRQRTES